MSESKKNKKETSSTEVKKPSSKLWIIPVLLVIALAVGIGLTVTSKNTVDPSAFPAQAVQPSGAIKIGSGPQKLEIFEDFECPSCANFEVALGDTIDGLIADNKVTVYYYPLSFVDPKTSLTATAASGCAANENKFLEYHNALFDEFPVKQAKGESWTIASLTEVGENIGLGSTFADCVKDSQFASWAQKVNQTGTERDIIQTPTIFLNDKQIDLSTLTMDKFRGMFTENNPKKESK